MARLTELEAYEELHKMLDAARENEDGPLALMALDPVAALERMGDANPWKVRGLEPGQNELSLLSGIAQMVLRERKRA